MRSAVLRDNAGFGNFGNTVGNQLGMGALQGFKISVDHQNALAADLKVGRQLGAQLFIGNQIFQMVQRLLRSLRCMKLSAKNAGKNSNSPRKYNRPRIARLVKGSSGVTIYAMPDIFCSCAATVRRALIHVKMGHLVDNLRYKLHGAGGTADFPRACLSGRCHGPNARLKAGTLEFVFSFEFRCLSLV